MSDSRLPVRPLLEPVNIKETIVRFLKILMPLSFQILQMYAPSDVQARSLRR
jgi:hypothetical protein